jgi:hypothetical protein
MPKIPATEIQPGQTVVASKDVLANDARDIRTVEQVIPSKKGGVSFLFAGPRSADKAATTYYGHRYFGPNAKVEVVA